MRLQASLMVAQREQRAAPQVIDLRQGRGVPRRRQALRFVQRFQGLLVAFGDAQGLGVGEPRTQALDIIARQRQGLVASIDSWLGLPQPQEQFRPLQRQRETLRNVGRQREPPLDERERLGHLASGRMVSCCFRPRERRAALARALEVLRGQDWIRFGGSASGQ